MEGKTRAEQLDNALRRREFEVLPAGGLEERTRAMLKVQDGCVNFCSYCIIPYTRGPIRSAPVDVAVSQAQELARRGYREIVVTGIEISSLGARDRKNGETLIDLLEAVCTAAPAVRIRLGSLEPRTITEEFCRRAAALPNLCPQFHLSMQSGCDATLKRMNRKYDTTRYAQSVALLNQYFDHPAVTTDLITGFPEETEEEFAQTLDFIRRCGFAQMHIFPYSVRPGTPAAKMRQVPKAVKEERARQAAAVAEALHRNYLAACVGAVYPVLFEQPKDGRYFGHAPNYMEVLADVVMLPGESFVRAIVQTWNTNFGTTKIMFDSSMTIIAGGLSVIFFGKLNGVREGTIIAALLVGFIARLFGKHLEFVKPYIFPENYETNKNHNTSDENGKETSEARHKNVIVIGRQYGSGGHDIGKILADKLGFDFLRPGDYQDGCRNDRADI